MISQNAKIKEKNNSSFLFPNQHIMNFIYAENSTLYMENN